MTMIQARDRAGAAWVLLLSALGAIGCGSDTANVGELTGESRRSNSTSSDGSGASDGSATGGASSTNSNNNSSSSSGSASSDDVGTASNTAGPLPPRACDIGDALDSRWLVFDSDGGTSESERRIYAVESEGGTVPQPLTPQNVLASDPVLSPDGSELAYVADGMVRVLNLNSGDDEGLVEGDQPAWSPNGRSLAYHADRGVWLFDVQERVSMELATCPDCSLGGYQNPEFSHDGDVLVMDRENQIELLELGTGEMHEVVENGKMSITHPTLSPDAGSVVAELECEPGFPSLWLYEAGETTLPCAGRRIDPGGSYTRPSWGPNSVIAFELSIPNVRGIVLLDMEADLGCALVMEGVNQNPSWAPHGWQPPDGD